MRPVDSRFPVSQEFGSFATGGVVADSQGTQVQQLVAAYGNYQPYGHAGQDIACPIGTPVHAIADGTVLWADWGTNLPGDESWSPSGYLARWALYKTFPGIVTLIQHDGWISVYAHLSDAPLNPGDRVREGQEIARSGNTRSPGVSLGAHLHVEALVDMSYGTGNGLIYGRTNPEPFYGAMAAMGSTITPITEEDDMTPDQAQQLAEVHAVLFNGSDGTPRPFTVYDRVVDIQMALTNTLPSLMNMPAAVLNQSFKLADGTVTNLAGILTAIHAQPTTAPGPVSTDVQAVADAVAATLSKKLGK